MQSFHSHLQVRSYLHVPFGTFCGNHPGQLHYPSRVVRSCFRPINNGVPTRLTKPTCGWQSARSTARVERPLPFEGYQPLLDAALLRPRVETRRCWWTCPVLPRSHVRVSDDFIVDKREHNRNHMTLSMTFLSVLVT